MYVYYRYSYKYLCAADSQYPSAHNRIMTIGRLSSFCCFQFFFQELSGVTGCAGRYFFGSTGYYKVSPTVASFWTKVYDIVLEILELVVILYNSLTH